MDYLPKKKSEVIFNGSKNFDVGFWKSRGLQDVQTEFEQRYDEIKIKFEELREEIYWNKVIYDSEFKFEPKIGQIYHLYTKEDSSTFLSLISPNEWNNKTLGSFRFNYDRKWLKI